MKKKYIAAHFLHRRRRRRCGAAGEDREDDYVNDARDGDDDRDRSSQQHTIRFNPLLV